MIVSNHKKLLQKSERRQLDTNPFASDVAYEGGELHKVVYQKGMTSQFPHIPIIRVKGNV